MKVLNPADGLPTPAWAKENGFEPISLTKFGRYIKSRYAYISTNFILYKGIGLLDS